MPERCWFWRIRHEMAAHWNPRRGTRIWTESTQWELFSLFSVVHLDSSLRPPGTFLSGRNGIYTRNASILFLKILKFVENSPRWVDFSVKFPSRVQNQQICLISLYACKGNVKGNQVNLLILDSRGKFHTKIDPSRGIFDEFQKFLNFSSWFFFAGNRFLSLTERL